MALDLNTRVLEAGRMRAMDGNLVLDPNVRLTTDAVRRLIPFIHDRKTLTVDQVTPRQRRDLENSGWMWEPVPPGHSFNRAPHLDAAHTNGIVVFFCTDIETDALRSTCFGTLALATHAYLHRGPAILAHVPVHLKERAKEALKVLQTHADQARYYQENGAPIQALTYALNTLARLLSDIKDNKKLIPSIQYRAQFSEEIWRPEKVVLASLQTPHHRGRGRDDVANLYYAQVAA